MNKHNPDYGNLSHYNPLPKWVYNRATYEIHDANQCAIGAAVCHKYLKSSVDADAAWVIVQCH